MRARHSLAARATGLLVPLTLSVLTALPIATRADAAGPSYPPDGADRRCLPGTHAVDNPVAQGADGRYKRYNLAGSHYFDAEGVVFDGLSDGGEPVNVPVKLSAASRQFFRRRGHLAEPAAVGEERWDEYAVGIPRKTRHARFRVRFDTPDPGRKLYLKLTAPSAGAALDIVGPPARRGLATGHAFFNHPSDTEELAIVAEPVPGTWTVRVAVIGGAGTDVGYELTVDSHADIASGGGRLATPRAGGETHHEHTVRVPEGTTRASFRVRFDRDDPGDKLYMKLTGPKAKPAVREFVDESGDASESRTRHALEAGEWSVRVASKRGAADGVRYAFTVDTDEREQPSIGCWYGGTVHGAWDENDPELDWETPYHRSTGLMLEHGHFLVENISIHGQGDGIASYGENNVIDAAYLTDIHDDCIENDDLHDLSVVNSFLDGCYVAFSARSFEHVPPFDGRGRVMEVRNSLVRLEAQPEHLLFKPRAGEGPGHGQFFKWNHPGGPDEDIALGLALHDNLFVAGRDSRNPGGRGLLEEALGSITSCSGNLIVWLGEGPFPDLGSIREAGFGEDCFRISTDEREWRAAEAAWHAWRGR